MQSLSMKSIILFSVRWLRGHIFFNLHLQNEITGQETHFSICFCPLEFAGNNELYGRMVGFINIYQKVSFLIGTSPESLDNNFIPQ